MVDEFRIILHGLDQGIQDGFGRQSIGITMKRGNHIRCSIDIFGFNGNNISIGYGDIIIGGKGIVDLLGDFRVCTTGKGVPKSPLIRMAYVLAKRPDSDRVFFQPERDNWLRRSPPTFEALPMNDAVS